MKNIMKTSIALLIVLGIFGTVYATCDNLPAQYDENNNCLIDTNELKKAVVDYIDGDLTGSQYGYLEYLWINDIKIVV